MFTSTSPRARHRRSALGALVTPCLQPLEARRLLTAAATNPGGAPNAPFNLAAKVVAADTVQFSFMSSAARSPAGHLPT